MVLEAETVFLIDLLAIFAVYVIVNLSLNLEFGYTGIPNFGKVLAVGAGAFVAASIPGRIFANIAGIEGDYIENNLAIVSQINVWLVDNTGIGFAVFFLTLRYCCWSWWGTRSCSHHIQPYACEETIWP